MKIYTSVVIVKLSIISILILIERSVFKLKIKNYF